MTFVNHLRGYSLSYTESAIKDLNRIKKNNQQDAQAIDKKLRLLIEGRQGLDIKKLVSFEQSRYRLRVKAYRVLFEIRSKQVIVLVAGIKHRKDVY